MSALPYSNSAMEGMTEPPPKVVTSFWMKPIPLRQFDWSAVYDDYEGPDGDGVGGGPVGFGRTEQEAISDLTENFPR